jgi:mannosyltransferase OCH1-like enzyme
VHLFDQVLVAKVDQQEEDTGTTIKNRSTIPPILHFIHISHDISHSNNEFPQIVKDNIKDWKRMHPHWKIHEWTNEQVRREQESFAPGLKSQLLERITGPRAWISDLLRYAILYKYGGVYVDTDVVPIQPLDPLLVLKDFTVCEKAAATSGTATPGGDPSSAKQLVNNNTINWTTCELACNAVIGTAPQNPALQATLQLAVANTETQLQTKNNARGSNYRIEYTGPTIWTQVARQYDVTLLNTSTFYPCSWEDTKECIKEKYPTSFAMHKWSMTWVATEERNMYHPEDKK